MGIFSSGVRATRALAGMGVAAVMAAALAATPAFADSRNVATYGVDLTAEQHAQVERFFGTGATNAEVIYVNNDQERMYLSAYIPLEQIGDKTYSCALVQPTTSGGIHVKTANLTYVTSDMIAATLATSGVKNCDVIAVCPFKVSGTGALTGVLMAYEQASGTALDASKKDLANQELITTGTIADTVGPDVATLIVNDVKANVIKQGVTEITDIDNIVNNVVNNIINDYSTTVVDNSTTTVDNSTTIVDNSTTNVTVTDPSASEGSDSAASDSASSDAADSNAADSSSGSSDGDSTGGLELSDDEMQALRDFAHALAEQGYSYDDMRETLEMVSKNASQAAGLPDPMAPEDGTASSSAADRSASSDKASSAPADTAEPADALPQDSILNQTEDTALGEDTVVDSTDLSTISEGVETRQEVEAAESAAADAPAESSAADVPAESTTADGPSASAPAASEPAAEPAATEPAADPDDPFASLTWDETTTGGSDLPAGTDASVNPAATTTETPAEVPAAGEAPTQVAGTDAAGETIAPSAPRAGETLADTLGLPASADGQGVTLALGRTMVATSLVEGTTDPYLIYEDGDGKVGIMSYDGQQITETGYAAGGIRGVGDGWILATSATGQTDVLLEVAIEDDAAQAEDDLATTYLAYVATLDGKVLQAKASDGYLNVQTEDGTLAAFDEYGVLDGVTPVMVDDFSYAETSAEEPSAEDAQAEGTEGVETATDGVVEDAVVPDAEPEVAQPEVIPSALPAGAKSIDGTEGTLWLVSQAGKASVCDASGTDVLGRAFDTVRATADGSWLLVTDGASKESALYRVELVPEL